jgi:hypothetical protein
MHLRDCHALAIALVIASGAPVSAQKYAPGPALPPNTGGIGPGGTTIAPGPAGGPLIEQEGPGGVPLAIGSQIEGQPPLRASHHPHHAHHVRRVPQATSLRDLR